MTSMPRPLGAAAGIALDRMFGEPATALHPVVHFGRAMDAFERRNFDDAREPGVLHALTGALIGVTAGVAMRSTAWATGLAVGGRSLWRAADAIVAPVLWAAFAGAPGALGYRAANTMDAMVGHHSDRYELYGWASARLDDVANWIPARIAAVLVALVRPAAARDVRSAIFTQASAHPSPNAGVVEAAFAGALGVRLGGRNQYGDRVEDRPILGSGRAVNVADIQKAVRLSRDVTTSLAVALALIGFGQWWHRR
jgi:adenosylcobinamide-phosphate synthase